METPRAALYTNGLHRHEVLNYVGSGGIFSRLQGDVLKHNHQLNFDAEGMQQLSFFFFFLHFRYHKTFCQSRSHLPSPTGRSSDRQCSS